MIFTKKMLSSIFDENSESSELLLIVLDNIIFESVFYNCMNCFVEQEKLLL